MSMVAIDLFVDTSALYRAMHAPLMQQHAHFLTHLCPHLQTRTLVETVHQEKQPTSAYLTHRPLP
jgi:hypothetical protein